MALNYSQLPLSGQITGPEIVSLMQGGVTVQTTCDLMSNFIRNQGTFSSPLTPSGNINTDTANMKAAFSQAASSARNVPTLSDPLCTAVIYLSPGTFQINDTVLTAAMLTSKIRGLMIVGMGGLGQTAILFTPATARPFIVNQRWQGLIFIDIGFSCNVAGCDFLQSQELAGVTNVQHDAFIRCSWNGWQNDFILTGANNNSEFSWDTCSFGATTSNILYVPPTATTTITAGNANLAVGNSPEVLVTGTTVAFTGSLGNITANVNYYVIQSTTTSFQIATTANGAALVPSASGTLSVNAGSDQFLNYSFNNCNYGPGTSNAPWINMAKGGHIVFSGTTDVSGWAPTADTYLINTLGFSHARGVQNLLINKFRVEYLSAFGKLWHNQWPGGGANCTLQNVDESSTLQAATINHVLVELSNNSGANIVYDNCNFQGTHSYSFGSNNFTVQNSVVYRSCNFLQQPNAKAFCLSIGAVNSGGIAAPSFDIACRGSDQSEIFFTDLNWQLSSFGLSTVKVVNFVGANSTLPTGGSNIQRKLPPNCVLRSVHLSKAADASSGAFSYNLQTTEATPTVLANIAGANAGAAINVTVTTAPMPFTMDTDVKRTVQLVDAQNRPTAMTGNFTADYVG